MMWQRWSRCKQRCI